DGAGRVPPGGPPGRPGGDQGGGPGALVLLAGRAGAALAPLGSRPSGVRPGARLLPGPRDARPARPGRPDPGAAAGDAHPAAAAARAGPARLPRLDLSAMGHPG